MSTISYLSALVEGAQRQVNLSANVLSVGALQINGSTSGAITHEAAATTSSYSLIWPSAQAGGSGYALFNDGSGNLSWASASSGANTALSNLTTTSINQDLLPSANLTRTLGSNTLVWSSMWIKELLYPSQIDFRLDTGLLYNSTGSSVVDFTNTLLSDNSQNKSIDWTNRILYDGAGNAQISWFAGGMQIGSNASNTGGSAFESGILGIANDSAGGEVVTIQNTSTTTGYNFNLPATSGSSGQALLSGGGSNNPMTWSDILTAALPSAEILVGNGSNIATAVAVSGDVSLDNTGAFTIESIQGTAVSGVTGTGDVVFSASPTLTGTLSAAAVSLTGALNMNSNQINNLADPSSAQDAATKNYVDSLVNGLTWKGPVAAYSNANVALTGSTPLVIDGYTVVDGDLLLLAAQTDATTDGEYTAAITGGTYVLTANGQPTAAGDAWLVLNGTTYANSAFVATAAVPAATFIEFAGPNAYSFTSPLSLTGNTVSISKATTSTDGYLSSTDWNTFNDKQAAGSYITALTGDGTASGPGSAAFTLATVNSDTGSFGSSTSIPTFTVNAKGLITAASGNAVIAPAGTLSGTTLNSTVVSSSLTSVGTITSGTWTGTAIAIANGGTGQTSQQAAFDALSPMTTAGDIIYEDATPESARLAIGNTGQVLTVVSGLPAWATLSVTPAEISLTDGYILVGNGSNVAAAVQMSGDVEISDTGATTIQSGVVSASKLGSVTDGITTDQNGAGSTIEVLNAPSIKRTLIAGQTFTANISYAVRWGITANSETAGRIYAADITTSSYDLFYVIGMASSGTTVNAGGSITVTSLGLFPLSSGDTTFAGTAAGSDGLAVFLTASGTFSLTPPSSSGQAVTRIGILRIGSATATANIIDVDPTPVGVN